MAAAQAQLRLKQSQLDAEQAQAEAKRASAARRAADRSARIASVSTLAESDVHADPARGVVLAACMPSLGGSVGAPSRPAADVLRRNLAAWPSAEVLKTPEQSNLPEIEALGFTPDGEHLLANGYFRVAQWRVAQLRAGARWLYRDIRVESIAFTQAAPTGLVVGGSRWGERGEEGVVRVVDLKTGKITALPVPMERVYSVAWSRDGKWLAAGGPQGGVHVWKWARHSGWTSVRAIQLVPYDGHNYVSNVELIGFSPDSAISAAAAGSVVEAWRMNALMSKEAARQVLRCENAIFPNWLLFEDEESYFGEGADACGCDLGESSPRCEPRKLAQFFPGEEGFLVAGPYGEPLAVTGGENAKDHGIELWNLQGQPIRTATLRSPDQKNRSVESLSYSQNGRRLAVSYGNAAIDIWTLEGTPQRIRALSTDPFTIAGGGLATMAFSPEEDTLVGGDRFGTVHLWYLNDSKPRLSSLRGLEGPVDVLAYSHDGNQIAAAGSQQGRILVWSVRRPKQLPIILEGHEKGVRSIVFARDGARLYSSGAEDTVRVWRLYSRDLLRFARDTVHRPPLRQFEFLNLVQPFFPDLEFSPHLNSCERVLRREGKP